MVNQLMQGRAGGQKRQPKDQSDAKGRGGDFCRPGEAKMQSWKMQFICILPQARPLVKHFSQDNNIFSRRNIGFS
jgi:hypothetical protein